MNYLVGGSTLKPRQRGTRLSQSTVTGRVLYGCLPRRHFESYEIPVGVGSGGEGREFESVGE